ncbi:MAG TPA: nuclear transport factor 2 family protein [Candidatus Binataceae bacterium]|nr:nuclear transport factor 2 family protein [Candidatus Binataceae bacterium]
MLVIDPYRTWQTLAERLKTEKNPLHRRQLEQIIHHMKGEAAGDIDQILTTVSPKASYISHDNPAGPPRIFKGHDEIRRFYNQMFAAVSVNLEYFVERLAVDDYLVVTEGASKSAMKGSSLAAMGIPVEDPNAFYLGQGRNVVVWPFDQDGMILGEYIYPGSGAPIGEAAKHKLCPEEIGKYEATV